MIFMNTVLISDIPNRCYPKKTASGVTYLYAHTGDKYNPEKKYAIPVRVAIGKVDPEDSTKLLPNNNFFKLFPNVPLLEEKEPVRSRSQCIGPHLFINQIVKELTLDKLLKKHFGDYADLILDIASFMLICEDNAMNHFSEYAASHPLFREDQHIVSDETLSRFLSNTANSDIVIAFMEDWNKRCSDKEIFISFDASNKNCHAGDVEFVELGHSKVDRGTPIWNYGMGLDIKQCIPLFFHQYPSSIPDVSQVKQLVDKAKHYGYKKINFIIDRGFCSMKNIEYIDEAGYNSIVMLKGQNALVTELIDSNWNTFQYDCGFDVSQSDCISGKTLEHEFAGKNRYFHLFWDANKSQTDRRTLKARIADDHLLLKRSLGCVLDNPKAFDDYFSLHFDKNGKLELFTLNEDAVNAQIRRAGHFVIVTSAKMTAKEAYELYKMRDASEKVFSTDKTFLDSLSLREQSTEIVSFMMFIEFIALIIRSRTYALVKDAQHKLEYGKLVKHIPNLFQLLSKVTATRVSRTGDYVLDSTCSQLTKMIFSMLGMDETQLSSEGHKLLEKMSAAAIEYEKPLGPQL